MNTSVIPELKPVRITAFGILRSRWNQIKKTDYNQTKPIKWATPDKKIFKGGRRNMGKLGWLVSKLMGKRYSELKGSDQNANSMMDDGFGMNTEGKCAVTTMIWGCHRVFGATTDSPTQRLIPNERSAGDFAVALHKQMGDQIARRNARQTIFSAEWGLTDLEKDGRKLNWGITHACDTLCETDKDRFLLIGLTFGHGARHAIGIRLDEGRFHIADPNTNNAVMVENSQEVYEALTRFVESTWGSGGQVSDIEVYSVDTVSQKLEELAAEIGFESQNNERRQFRLKS